MKTILLRKKTLKIMLTLTSNISVYFLCLRGAYDIVRPEADAAGGIAVIGHGALLTLSRNFKLAFFYSFVLKLRR